MAQKNTVGIFVGWTAIRASAIFHNFKATISARAGIAFEVEVCQLLIL